MTLELYPPAPEKRRSAWLVQQGVWDMPMESMPLAAGYVKATALADTRIAAEMNIEIFNYRGGLTLSDMANDLFQAGTPDILAFSVAGWNSRTFAALAETFKQLNPDGWVVMGGTHVAHQAARVFPMFPEVDVIVNGEGEFIFADLLNAFLDGTKPGHLGAITGIAFKDDSGAITTTEERPRIEDLDVIPSPFLTGAIRLTDENGAFPYDVALMETNRGCPYKCSFCFWGGAVGQRVRAFSRARLRSELELMAQLKVETIVLCDANFGMLPIDVEFVQDLIEVKEQYGYPKTLETSWAKNKSKVFYNIVRDMKRAGLRSSFTLALQTLSGDALDRMNRKNMKVNDWTDLVEWLEGEGLDCYAEIIWGSPGETVRSFLEGYDRLSHHVSRIAAYPLLLLPNTDYSEKKKDYGFITIRGDNDDFEYVLAHDSMSLEDNRQMHRFLFWARVIAENLVLRNIWTPLRILGGMEQSQVLLNLGDWVDKQTDSASAPLREIASKASGESSAVGPALVFLHGNPDGKAVLARWWREAIDPLLPEKVRPLLADVFAYDLLTLPICNLSNETDADDLEVVDIANEQFYRRRPIKLTADVPALIAALKAGETPAPEQAAPVESAFYYKVGFSNFVSTTNHEESAYFVGRMEREVVSQAPSLVS
ncbi:MAG: KedN5 family methylcobalamin-dependent radical SAM C-methyltransferase [Geodermatophilaceae bacterium]